MYNSSDIFCLKEPKFGENDGSLMFSIKGTSSSKMCTSHNVSNDVFYDHPQMSESTQTPIQKQDETETALEAADQDEDEVDEPVASSSMIHKTTAGDDELEASGPSALIENEQVPNRNEYAVGHEASARGEPGVSSSNMIRNPVTGVGLEDDLVTSRRHFHGKPDHLLW